MIGRSLDRLEQAKAKLHSTVGGGWVECYDFDISDENKVKAFYKTMDENKCNIDYLFNVAGVGVFGRPEDVTREQIDCVLDSNLIGMILMTTGYLRQSDSGKIINVMSTAARIGKVNEAIYCASKWGARGYTEALKTTYKGTDMKVIGVYPGGMDTPFWQNSMDMSECLNPEEVSKQIVQAVLNDQVYVSDIVIERV